MKKLQNEVKIGLTIVIAIIISIIGFRLMQDVPLFRPSLQIYTVYDRVDGITTGTTVHMSGVKIGSVQQVSLEGPDSVHVILNISHLEGIPVGSVAIIESTDLISSKSIQIHSSGDTEMIPDGGYIEGEYDAGAFSEMGNFADEVKPDIKRSTGSLADVLSQFDEILKNGGKDDLQQTLSALNQSTGKMNEVIQRKSGELEQSIESLQNFMMNLDTLSSGRSAKLDSLLNNLDMTSREFNTISQELSGVSYELNIMMQNINNGDGTIGKLIQDPSLYNNLDSLAINLKNISKKMDEDPGQFLKYMRLMEIF